MIWNKDRIERDKELKKSFGLVRKREIWKAETTLRKYRRLARMAAAAKNKKAEKELLEKLVKLGLLSKGAGLDDVLGLSVESVLERRLQTIVFRKGLASSPKEARQMIVHGHVRLGDKKSSYPGNAILKEDEDKISVVKKMAKKPVEVPEEKVEEQVVEAQE